MKRGAIVGLAAGVVAVAAVGGGIAWSLLRHETAEEAAGRYVRALEEGDRDALAGFLADDPERDRLLAMFAGATGRISDATLSATGRDGGFRADVTIGDGQGVVFFALSDESGRWQLSADDLGTLEATTTVGDAVEIGGVPTSAGAVSLLPAVYPVAPAPAAVLSGGSTVAVTNEEPVTVEIEASLSPEAPALAQQQLDAYARACAAPATAVPSNCGLRVPWGADLTSLTSLDFRIEKTPQVVLAPDAASFAATGGVIVATARGAARAGGDDAFTYRADDWSFYGSVSFAGGEMVLSVR
ncbi:MAG: hypothetical protein QM602_11570 [Microbacterium sp.]